MKSNTWIFVFGKNILKVYTQGFIGFISTLWLTLQLYLCQDTYSETWNRLFNIMDLV